jgi:hypothetical protein
LNRRFPEDSALFLQRLDSRRREGREHAVGEPGEVIIVGRQRPDRLRTFPVRLSRRTVGGRRRRDNSGGRGGEGGRKRGFHGLGLQRQGHAGGDLASRRQRSRLGRGCPVPGRFGGPRNGLWLRAARGNRGLNSRRRAGGDLGGRRRPSGLGRGCPVPGRFGGRRNGLWLRAARGNRGLNSRRRAGGDLGRGLWRRPAS